MNEQQQDDINAARDVTSSTRRPTVPALEEILHQPMPVLDHGFIRLVDYMGDDAAVVQAARVSYGRGTRRLQEDRGLIRYLMRHWHTTPFEMCELKLHVKLPIFVARQWIRHRTANVNEYSARYSILDKEFYIPEAGDIAGQSTANKQGRTTLLGPEAAHQVRELLRDDSERAYRHYLWLLNEGSEDAGAGERPEELGSVGVSRELARIGLGLNTYTQWYWKTDLHNLLRFLRLRADPHAQYEIRAYAEAILSLVERWVPLTYEAFLEYQLGAFSLSATALEVVRRMIGGEAVTAENSRLSQREWIELAERLGISVSSY